MLREESEWIGKTISVFFKPGDFPMLNVGSSTAHFRSVVQPHIEANIFAPLKNSSRSVYHLDMKSDEGVDLVGDLDQAQFRESLNHLGIRSILCSNLLEHLKSPETICRSILSILPAGGKLLVTVPYDFPYHKDPIDTMLRPTVEELHGFFPGTDLIAGTTVYSDRSYLRDLLSNPKYLFIMLARLGMPFFRSAEWRFIARDFLRSRKKYSATCVLLSKNSGSAPGH